MKSVKVNMKPIKVKHPTKDQYTSGGAKMLIGSLIGLTGTTMSLVGRENPIVTTIGGVVGVGGGVLASIGAAEANSKLGCVMGGITIASSLVTASAGASSLLTSLTSNPDIIELIEE